MLLWRQIHNSFLNLSLKFSTPNSSLFFEIYLVLLIFWWLQLMGFLWQLVVFTKWSLIMFIVEWFLLLSHFLIVEDYELPQSPSHLLSLSVTLEYSRILYWSISFFLYINFLPDDVACKIDVWADVTTRNSTRDKTSDLS